MEYVPTSEVLAELEQKLAEPAKPDYITLSGSGEPTLHNKIGDVITDIKNLTDIPVAVLTNGSLLWMPEVRESLCAADLVKPSLSAGDEAIFQYVNRPHPDITFEKLLDGLIAFRKKYTGQIWLEVFLLGGVTGLEAEVKKIAGWIEKIKPDKVQINTVTRPPAEEFAYAVPAEQLHKLVKMLGENADIIADYRGTHKLKEFTTQRSDVLALLERRPCSLDDIANGLGIHRNEAIKYIGELVSLNAIESELIGGNLYYKVTLSPAREGNFE